MLFPSPTVIVSHAAVRSYTTVGTSASQAAYGTRRLQRPGARDPFWLASALARTGRIEEADLILDRVEQRFAALGLLPEEVAPHGGDALGKIPLVFAHAEHLKAVMDRGKQSLATRAQLAAGMLWRKASSLLS